MSSRVVDLAGRDRHGVTLGLRSLGFQVDHIVSAPGDGVVGVTEPGVLDLPPLVDEVSHEPLLGDVLDLLAPNRVRLPALRVGAGRATCHLPTTALDVDASDAHLSSSKYPTGLRARGTVCSIRTSRASSPGPNTSPIRAFFHTPLTGSSNDSQPVIAATSSISPRYEMVANRSASILPSSKP